MSRIRLEFDLSDVRRSATRTKRAIGRLVERIAEQLAEEAAEEARPVSRRLGRKWPIETRGPAERRVVAPEFFAHFLAHGTRDHGPRGRRHLAFEADGAMVFARRVRGIRANPFHERARKTVADRVDRLFGELIEQER